MYILLALVFAVGFVAFGVGSGSTGISDILNGSFFGGSTSGVGSQIKSDQKKIASHPSETSAYIDLSQLYQQEHKTLLALRTVKSGLKVQPKNTDLLGALASVYRTKAESARTSAADAQAALSSSYFTPPGVDQSSTFGSAFLSDPVSEALKSKANTSFSDLTSSYTQALDAYQRVASVTRGGSAEANAQLQLGSFAIEALNYTGDTTDAEVAATAYKRYLKLEPKGTSAAQARQTLAQLQPFLPKTHR
jgi:hypothetical protein